MIVREMIVIENPIGRTITVCVLTLLFCLASRASGEYESRELSNGGSNDGRSPRNDIKRIKQEIANGMWFGPRLGKRRWSNEKQEVNPDIEIPADPSNGVRYIVIAVPADEKKQPTFTPRLGRGSGEEIFPYGNTIERTEIDEDDHPSSPTYTPRRLWAPSPRLGRQLRNSLRKI